MYLTRNDLADLRRKLNGARQEAIDSGHTKHACHAPHVSKDGKTYRLEPKPKGRRQILEKNGHQVEDVAGVLHVRVSLGEHGIDHLAIDPATGKIVCALCHQTKKD